MQRRLGSFRDEVAAVARAYDEAARDLFREHARLNVADGVYTGLERAAAAVRAEAARARGTVQLGASTPR